MNQRSDLVSTILCKSIRVDGNEVSCNDCPVPQYKEPEGGFPTDLVGDSVPWWRNTFCLIVLPLVLWIAIVQGLPNESKQGSNQTAADNSRGAVDGVDLPDGCPVYLDTSQDKTRQEPHAPENGKNAAKVRKGQATTTTPGRNLKGGDNKNRLSCKRTIANTRRGTLLLLLA